MSDLKPCPFCGSKAVYQTYTQEYPFGTKRPMIFCNLCKIEFSREDESPYIDVDKDYEYRKNAVIHAWNRRKETEDECRKNN